MTHLKAADWRQCAWVTERRAFTPLQKGRAPLRKERNTNRWMWKVTGQHSRGIELIVASFLRWHLMLCTYMRACMHACVNKVHLILTLFFYNQSALSAKTTHQILAVYDLPVSNTWNPSRMFTGEGSRNSKCCVSSPCATTDSHKTVLSVLCHTPSCYKHRGLSKPFGVEAMQPSYTQH